MPQKCSVPNCSNSYKKTISLVGFPKDRKLRDAWIKAIGREEWTPRPHDRICEFHFKSTDWLDYKRKKLLKPTAVPSCFGDSSHRLLTSWKVAEKKTKVLRPDKLVRVRPCSRPPVKVLQTWENNRPGHIYTSRVPLDSKMSKHNHKVMLQSVEKSLKMEQSELRMCQDIIEAELTALNELLLWRDMEWFEPHCGMLEDQL